VLPSLQAVSMPAVENLPRGCFSQCTALSSIEFDPGFTGSTFGGRAFGACSVLQHICIPVSVTEIEHGCFADSGLRGVEFAAGSRLRLIGSYCFYHCNHLESFHVLSSVELVGENCFAVCHALREVTFEPNSQLRVFEHRLFADCTGLAQICVPSSVETIQDHVFGDACSMTRLTFELPSVLHEMLTFPRDCAEPVDVPDSVVTFKTPIALEPQTYACIRFGRDSRLQTCDVHGRGWQPNRFGRGFVQFSESHLKRTREDVEFTTEKQFRPCTFTDILYSFW
jgi:hypothetical protein